MALVVAKIEQVMVAERPEQAGHSAPALLAGLEALGFVVLFETAVALMRPAQNLCSTVPDPAVAEPDRFAPAPDPPLLAVAQVLPEYKGCLSLWTVRSSHQSSLDFTYFLF
jgi:hypothetical protein